MLPVSVSVERVGRDASRIGWAVDVPDVPRMLGER
jgi:hypothetical protein